jgi:hypothetical protein
MLNDGLGKCRKRHGDSVWEWYVDVWYIVGVMYNEILRLPYHNKICVMGWLIYSYPNLKSKGYEFDPLMHKKKQIN